MGTTREDGECPKCFRIREEMPDNLGYCEDCDIYYDWVTCSVCKGTGKIIHWDGSDDEHDDFCIAHNCSECDYSVALFPCYHRNCECDICKKYEINCPQCNKIEVSTLANGLVSDAEKDNPRLQTMAQQVGQDQIITLIYDKICNGDFESIVDIKEWLEEEMM